MSSSEETSDHAVGIRSTSDARRTQGLAICFLVLLFDGFDTTSIAFVAPVLASEWDIPISMFTPVFVATSVGAVVGYVVCGPLARSFGPRAVGGASVVLFGLGTMALTAAWDIASLSAVRFVSAIGLGAAVPTTIVAATNLVSERRKETATMLVASGLSAGAVTAGLVGGPLLRAYGPDAVFIFGGLLPLLVLPVFLRILKPAEPRGESHSKEESNSSLFTQLFAGDLAARTVLLWMFAFVIFVVTHALIFWTPALLLDFGIERDRTSIGTAAFGMGGLAGNVIMVFFVATIGTNRLLALTTILSMACVIAISQVDISTSIVLMLVAGLGAGAITGCIGEAVLAISFYPRHLRATGVGCATAIGRVGSIMGPAAGGLLLSFGWSADDVFLTALIPLALALITLAWLGYLLRCRAA